MAQAKQSRCFGTTSAGKVVDAVQLPKTGSNFKVFSSLAWFLGRTYVHKQVNDAIVATYQQLNTVLSEHVFMYAETGWIHGGVFKPHKTHQNGLSVDFMVPVKNAVSQSDYLPIGLDNKWGYAIEFNSMGEYETYRIDFEAMAEHLWLLQQTAEEQGFSIKRIYFDPQLQPFLFATVQGKLIENSITFNKKQAWVRHDEHYHVDFDIPCDTMR